MTSNYLTERYPNEGYKTPVREPSSYSFENIIHKPWKPKTKQDYLEQQEADEKQQELTKEFEAIKKLPCINVCKCGEEWENRFAKFQEGCYPYIEAVCNSCKTQEDINRVIAEKEARQRRLINDFDQQIPPRYRGKLTTPINKQLLTSTCSIIWGGFGTGKTWEAYTVAKELISHGEIKRFKLLTEIDLLNDLKDGFDDMQYKIRMYKELDLLILDEAGKNNDSDFNKAQLFGILNHRYDWEKKTILICNAKEKSEIRELLPTATLDRFRECVVEMNGSSKRYKV